MPKYNLDALGSEEFERLCQSLVQQVIGSGVKVYGMGKDGSREATFEGKAPYPSMEEQWDGNWIFQVKFHDIQQVGPREARRRLLAELEDELSKITKKYKHPCNNFILMTNVSLTPVFQSGIKDKIDKEIIPKYRHQIKRIHVWGAEEICRFLDAHPKIRQTYAHLLTSGDIIARLLRLIEKEETDIDELVRLYCQSCYLHEQYAALDDAGDVEDERVALQHVFIDLDVKPSSLPKDPQVLERLPEWLKQACVESEYADEKYVSHKHYYDEQTRIGTSALSYLFDDSILGLVLIGGPGEGKSTLGQCIAQIYRARLTGQLNDLGENIEEFEKCIARIPFRIILKEYAQWIASSNNSDNLFHYLALLISRESGKNANPEHIHKIIKLSPIILILDGLDEVPEKALRTKVLDNITLFVSQTRDVLKGNLRVVATTRPYGYSQEFDPVHYLHLTLQKLSTKRALAYAKRWTNVREPNPGEAERIQKTFEVCLKDRVVSVLTQTPLQVTILLVIIRARGTPPKQREELFERYMDIIYQREQKKRPELLRTEPDIIYGLHKYLAYILHRRAEKDKTAALMDVPEFKKRIKEYLIHINPLLKEKELGTKVNQIITEASQRLVLIESPQEGKFGFGLTTTREFFAAAHLVDTAKDTKERDQRFKAIARSPHWRNVVLFFAGRVGRTRPGEAPSMVDVCREIDTEAADKFLRRGAYLVMEMVDDRVLREPHNEIGAIQYGLTLLDRKRVKDSDELANKFKSLPIEYRKRVVCPWLEGQLNNVIPENIALYAIIYQKLCSTQKPLHDAIKRASEFDSPDVKLWALSQAIKNNVDKYWVMKLFEELVNTISVKKIAEAIRDYWFNFKSYLNFPLSLKARTTLTSALLTGIRDIHYPFESSHPKVESELSMINPEGKIRENWLLLWAVSQFLIQSALFYKEERFRKDWPVMFRLSPFPKVKVWINKNIKFIKEFCKTYSKEKEPFINFLVTLFEFFLVPHDLEKYIKVSKLSKQIQEEMKTISPITWFFLSSFGIVDEAEEKLFEYHKNLYTIYEHYTSVDQYKKDIEELNELINKKSTKIKNHPYKLLIWLDSNCESEIEKFLDLEILNHLKDWLKSRSLTESALSRWSVRIIDDDIESYELALKIVAKQLENNQKRLIVHTAIVRYIWHKLKTKQESIVAEQLKCIFEKVLANYSNLIDPGRRNIELLYCSLLSAGIATEQHIAVLYDIFHNLPNSPSMSWYIERNKVIQSVLQNMFKSKNLNAVRLAAVSLSGISRYKFSPYEQKQIKAEWVGRKYWELAKEKEDIWCPRYIEGMAGCQLKWSEKCEEWFEAIRDADTEEFRRAWAEVIREAGYYKVKDRDSLYEFLLRILGAGDAFPDVIRFAALQRLGEIVTEIDRSEIDEESLNLPLSLR